MSIGGGIGRGLGVGSSGSKRNRWSMTLGTGKKEGLPLMTWGRIGRALAVGNSGSKGIRCSMTLGTGKKRGTAADDVGENRTGTGGW